MLSSAWKRSVPILISVFLLTGCPVYPSVPLRPVTIGGTPEPFPCAHFADGHWQAFNFSVDTQEDVIAAVGGIWGIEQEGFQQPTSDRNDPLPRLSWEVVDAGVRYFAVFYEDGRLKEIDFLIAPYWHEDSARGAPLIHTAEEFAANPGSFPTLGQIVNCFGAPDYYSAYWLQDVEASMLHLALWYVNEGLFFAHKSWSKHHKYPGPPPYPPELSMHFATMLPAGDAGRMVDVRYGEENLGRRKAYVRCILRPWPGSIEAMGIEEERPYGYLSAECVEPTE